MRETRGTEIEAASLRQGGLQPDSLCGHGRHVPRAVQSACVARRVLRRMLAESITVVNGLK